MMSKMDDFEDVEDDHDEFVDAYLSSIESSFPLD